MSMTTILQHCLTGISLGGAYALIAIGYTLVYGILRLINFAHGDIFMMAGYFMIFSLLILVILKEHQILSGTIRLCNLLKLH